jgi:hypothetical protein
MAAVASVERVPASLLPRRPLMRTEGPGYGRWRLKNFRDRTERATPLYGGNVADPSQR